MNKYENISGLDQSLIGYGVVEAGATVEVPFLIENPNFRAVGSVDAGKSVVATTAPQPNAVSDASPATNNSQEEA